MYKIKPIIVSIYFLKNEKNPQATVQHTLVFLHEKTNKNITTSILITVL